MDETIQDTFNNLFKKTKLAFKKGTITIATLSLLAGPIFGQNSNMTKKFEHATKLEQTIQEKKTEYVHQTTDNIPLKNEINNLRTQLEQALEKDILNVSKEFSGFLYKNQRDSVNIKLKEYHDISNNMHDVKFNDALNTLEKKIDGLFIVRDKITNLFNTVQTNLNTDKMSVTDSTRIMKALKLSSEDPGLSAYFFDEFKTTLGVIDTMLTIQLEHDDIKNIHGNVISLVEMTKMKHVKSPDRNKAYNLLLEDLNKINNKLYNYGLLTANAILTDSTNINIAKQAIETYNMTKELRKHTKNTSLLNKISSLKSNLSNNILKVAKLHALNKNFDLSDKYLFIIKQFEPNMTTHMKSIEKEIVLKKIQFANTKFDSTFINLRFDKESVHFLSETKNLHPSFKSITQTSIDSIVEKTGNKVASLIKSNDYQSAWNFIVDVSKSNLSTSFKKNIVGKAEDALDVNRDSQDKTDLQKKIKKEKKKLKKPWWRR